MSFDYRKVGIGGYLFFYYGVGQTWASRRTGDIYKVEECEAFYSAQYYLVSINGVLLKKPVTAARLHFMLYEEGCEELEPGVLRELPLQVDECVTYFSTHESDCPFCGGKGVRPSRDGMYVNRCRHCTIGHEREIKEYCAQRRLREALDRRG